MSFGILRKHLPLLHGRKEEAIVERVYVRDYQHVHVKLHVLEDHANFEASV
jgi:hypothetical protein